MELNRRRLLAGLGAVAIAGCTEPTESTAGSPTPSPTHTATPSPTPDLPADCPTTTGLDVEWPAELDASSAGSFVRDYEEAYYREVVVEYEPESRVDSYELGVAQSGPPLTSGEGFEVEVSGSGGVYRPTLRLTASVSAAPAGVEPVPASEIEDDLLGDLLAEAAETGDADRHVDAPGEEVDRYVDLLASLSEEFEPLSSPGDEDSLSVDVDGTVVELEAQATRFHGDYWWTAYYYVDEHVLRRTDDEETDPREGELVECRT